jgi:hypothetical protein
MSDRRTHLKIKIKSLAAEARIIRDEVTKIKKSSKRCKDEDTERTLRWRAESLTDHRKGVVREEARHSLLAYGLIRNIPYSVMEEKCREKPNLKKVEEMARRFGANSDMIGVWMEAAKEWLKTSVEKR